MKTYVKDRNCEDQITKRLVFAADYAKLMTEEKIFIYIDETGFDSAQMPIYGYSKIGERCFYLGKPKGFHFSVIAAIIKDKILGFKIIR